MFKNVFLVFSIALLLNSCSTCKNTPSSSSSNASQDSYAQLEQNLQDFINNVGDRTFFPFDSCDLTDEAKSILSRQAEWLNMRSQYKIVVEGHCDERGTREYNLSLGERRADAVKRFLVSQGVDESRISTISYGKEKPAAIGNTEDIHRQNRRSVTTFSL